MATDVKTPNTLKGAEWLIRESIPSETFIPEDFNEEQKMVIDMCYSFLQAEIQPVLDRIDNLEARPDAFADGKSRRTGFAGCLHSGRIWRTGKRFYYLNPRK